MHTGVCVCVCVCVCACACVRVRERGGEDELYAGFHPMAELTDTEEIQEALLVSQVW